MKELNDIIQAQAKAVLQNKQTALVTVVKVEGSSYRRPGARMLVTEDGDITGAISGGCLEGDALRKAQFAMFEQKNKLEIYDTTDEEDNKLGIQLGCNGIVYILFEPLHSNDDRNPVNLLKKIAQQRKDAVLVTAFNANKNAQQKGTCGYINETESFFAHDEAQVLAEGSRLSLQQRNSIIKDDKYGTFLYQFIQPAIKLIIVGAGNDAQPLADIAFLLGWHIIVVDGRPAYATQQRFPKANSVLVLKPGDILSSAEIDNNTAVILMTHDYNYDVRALEQVVHADCTYVGVLGPKKKLNKMVDELKEKNIRIDEEKMQHIYGPVGLDIGAETSEEIALSIIAEIKTVFSKRNGGSLKERVVEIHDRSLISNHE